MDELLINNARFELAPGTIIAINMAINDLAEIKNRQGGYSNQFFGPKSETNKAIVENAEEITSGTLIPYRKLDAKVIKNGIELKGFSIFEEADDNYKISFYSGLTDFFSRIDGLSIRDLPGLAALNHRRNLTNIHASRTNTSGYIYSIIDNGSLSNASNVFDVRKVLPSVFDSTIVEAIYDYAGFNKSGAFLSDTRYTNGLTPCIGEAKLSPEYIDARLFKAYVDTPRTVSTTLTVGGTTFIRLPAFDDSSSDPNHLLGFDNGNLFGVTGVFPNQQGRYTANANLRMRFTGLYSFTTNIDLDFMPVVSINGALPVPGVWTNLATAGTHNYDFTSAYINVAPGTTVELYLAIRPYQPTPTFQPCVITMLVGGEFSNEIPNDQGFGYDFDTAYNLPDLSCKDFLKGIGNKYAILFDNKTESNTIRWAQFKEIADSRGVSDRDWSDKLDPKVTPRVEYRFGDYGQKNYLRYRDDETVPENLGRGEFAIDDENIPLSKDLVELPYAATQMTLRLLNLDVPSILKYDTVNNNFELKVEPRTLLLDRQTVAAGIDYYDGTTTITETVDIPLCYFELASKSVNLGFGNSLIPDNYSELIDVLNYLKKVTANFYLDQTDIVEMDFFLSVYVKKFSHWFYVNRIINYRGKDNSGKEVSTQVELIRL